MSGDPMAAFFRLHSGLPREAPGGAAETLCALALAAPPAKARIADMGCGPGASAAVLLAALPGAHVTGIDLHAPFVAEAARRAAALGAADRFAGRVADMAAPPVAPGTLDLIWSEGAVYNLGVARALAAWRPLLAPGGKVAFSDAVWLTAAPPARARAFWAAECPAMTDLPGLRDAVTGAGFRVLGDFVLPEACWDAYYGPLAARCDALAADPAMAEAIAETRAEIAVWTECRGAYGYAFVVAEPA